MALLTVSDSSSRFSSNSSSSACMACLLWVLSPSLFLRLLKIARRICKWKLFQFIWTLDNFKFGETNYNLVKQITRFWKNLNSKKFNLFLNFVANNNEHGYPRSPSSCRTARRQHHKHSTYHIYIVPIYIASKFMLWRCISDGNLNQFPLLSLSVSRLSRAEHVCDIYWLTCVPPWLLGCSIHWLITVQAFLGFFNKMSINLNVFSGCTLCWYTVIK